MTHLLHGRVQLALHPLSAESVDFLCNGPLRRRSGQASRHRQTAAAPQGERKNSSEINTNTARAEEAAFLSGRLEAPSAHLSTVPEGDGPPLLLLHALYESSRSWGDLPQHWNGPVFGVDFSGHGDSHRIRGGAYFAEILMGDADVALAEIGPAAVAGAGIGAYVALLLAGSRPEQVPAALLLPGAGLCGGGEQPDYGAPFAVTLAAALAEDRGNHDPFLRALESDVRPADYVKRFAAAARKLLMPELGGDAPTWWTVTRQTGRVEMVDSNPVAALGRLAAVLGR